MINEVYVMDTKILIELINEGLKSDSAKNHKPNELYLKMLEFCVESKKRIPLDNLIEYSVVYLEYLDKNDYDLGNGSLWLLMLIQECNRFNKSLQSS